MGGSMDGGMLMCLGRSGVGVSLLLVRRDMVLEGKKEWDGAGCAG